MNEENGFLDSVRKSTEKKEKTSDIPSFFGMTEDQEHKKLIEPLLPKKELDIEEYAPSKDDSLDNIEFKCKVHIFRLDNLADAFEYEELMNKVYNESDSFSDVRIHKNWDKMGVLTIVVEAVEIIEKEETDKDDPTKVKSGKPRPGKNTKVQKAPKGIQDEVMPTTDDFVEFSGKKPMEFGVPEELRIDKSEE